MVEMSMYSIGSAAFLREVFNGLAMITGTGDFVKAVMIGMLFSTLVVCFQAILRGGREIAWQNILLGWILYGMFFAVPARVIVEDVQNGETYVVDNVPLGAAASGFMISRVGHGLTELLETGYGAADRESELPFLSSLQYLVWAERIAGTDTGFTDYISGSAKVNVRATLNEYLRNCVVPYLGDNAKDSVSPGNQKIRELLKIGEQDPNNHSAIYRLSGSSQYLDTQPCSVVYKEISDTILPQTTEAKMQDYLTGLTSDWRGDDYAQGGAKPQSIGDIFDRMHIYAEERQDLLLATVIKPIFEKAYAQWNSRNQVVADLMIAQAMSQRNVQWAAEQTMWASVVHPLMTFFEGFIYAITPFVALLLCMGTVGFTLIGRYLQVLFWISLWMPIMSIGNLYLTMTVDRTINTLNLASMNGATDLIPQLQTQIATGGMLLAATPMLALFVVTGSNYAFTTLVSRLNGADHINEKMMSPDLMNVGAVLNEAEYMSADRTTGARTFGSEAFDQTIRFEHGLNQMDSSQYQIAHQDIESWNKTYSERTSDMQNVSKLKNWGKTYNAAVEKNFSKKDDSVKAAVYQLAQKGELGAKFGAGLNILGCELFSVGASYSGTISDADMASAHETLETSFKEATTESIASSSMSELRNTFGEEKASQYQHQAQKAFSASKTFSETSSNSNSFGGGFILNGKKAGELIAQAKYGKNGQAVQDALARGRDMLDADRVKNRAEFLQSSIGGNRTADQAYAQAILEGLSSLRTAEGAQAALDICTPAGVDPTPISGNPYQYKNQAGPRGLNAVENVTLTNEAALTKEEAKQQVHYDVPGSGTVKEHAKGTKGELKGRVWDATKVGREEMKKKAEEAKKSGQLDPNSQSF